MAKILTLEKYSLGVGDRFAHQAKAQLRACMMAAEQDGMRQNLLEMAVTGIDKQIEEAGLVVINKKDLLAGDAVDEVQQLLSSRYPEKNLLQ